MKDVLLLIISILPVIIIGTYIYKKDYNKEPLGILVKLFLGGIASVVIVLILTYILNTIFPSLSYERIVSSNAIKMFFKIFVGIALVEEGSKWIITYLISYNSKHFDEFFDIVLYCVFVALGFACIENILYVFQGGLTTGILRLFTAVPGHCFFGVLMGEYLGLAKINEGNSKLKKKNMILSILLPALLHCVYDFFALLGGVYAMYLFFAILIFGYLISIDKIKYISKMGIKRYSSNYCTNCGSKVEGNFCSHCGKRQI